jgi:hypothetical protein
MKTQNPILQSTIHLICSRLALPALGLALIASSSNLGATDFFSFRDGSWFGPHNDLSPSPWVPSGVPGNGDNVTISHNIQFDSSSAVVTVSNLDIDGGTLSVSVSGPATLGMAGTNSYWNGGCLRGPLLQVGSLTLGGTNIVGDSGYLSNQGTVYQATNATLNLAFSSTFVNQAGGTYDLEGDGGMVNDSAYWYWTSFNNYGLLRKSSGTGVSTIGVLYYNYGGTIQVDSGTLSLAFGGSSSNGTFNVASGAVLDLTGGSSPTWAGEVSGSGTGAVSLSSGTINSSPSLTLNLLGGLFQWTGGNFSGTTINSNVVTIAGSNSVTVGDGSIFYNDGFVHHTNAATLLIGYGAAFANQAGGTYNLEGDGGFSNFNMYRGAAFNNSGLLRKSGGNGTSVFNFVTFNNQNGTIEVDSGTLSLAFGGSSSNGTFNVASGAVLDLTGGSSPTWAGQIIGSGAGTVSLNSGTISSSPSLTLNLPGGLFQWTGGNFSGTTINSNMVTIAGSNSVAVGDWSIFYNYGLLRHTNTATLNLAFSSTFVNQAGGTYDLEGDGGMVNGSAYWYWTSFNNYGLLRKSSGTGVSTIGVLYYNYDGSIEVDSGQLSLNGHSYAQGSGSFIVTLGGTNAGQSGQLLCGPATLGGPLQVKLASGYLPALGDQFQILSCSSLAGAFSSTNMPAGISVSYSNNGVYLVVTGTVPAQILNPAVSNGNFTFSLGTVNSQSYTVQHNDDLATTNWVFDTNFTGNGSLMQCFVPVTNVPQRFFRVSQP